MKNIPRIYLNEKIEIGKQILLSKDMLHYLTRVMRTDECLVFNDGVEFAAKLIPNSSFLIPDSATGRKDPANDVTFYFAPIKKMDDMLNMVTQMGVAVLQPVITDRTIAHHVNWSRMEKIIIEASEQSNRNSVPVLLKPQKFDEFLQGIRNQELVFADERCAYNSCHVSHVSCLTKSPSAILIGPEGGFSDSEFNALDTAGAIGMSLGKTILRAETAAVAALAQLITKN